MKNLIILFFIFILTSCANTSGHYDFGKGKTLLWKVSDKDSYVWILGSIHFADSSFYPLQSVIENAFESSNAFALELDIENEETQNENAQAMLLQGKFSDGKTLKNVLPDSLWTAFDSICSDWKIPSSNFMQYRPWMAATLLSTYAFMRMGIDSDLGIDAYLLEKAYASDKEIIALETPQEQIEALAPSNMDIEEDVLYIANTLDEINNMDSMITHVLLAWKTGNIELLKQELGENTPDKKSNEYDLKREKRLLTDRNLKMAKNIEEFLKENKNVFVVVGAGHLILGENHVLKLLRDKGYIIERF